MRHTIDNSQWEIHHDEYNLRVYLHYFSYLIHRERGEGGGGGGEESGDNSRSGWTEPANQPPPGVVTLQLRFYQEKIEL